MPIGIGINVIITIPIGIHVIMYFHYVITTCVQCVVLCYHNIVNHENGNETLQLLQQLWFTNTLPLYCMYRTSLL